MIRRGTVLSRVLALLVVSAPLTLPLLGGVWWAMSQWRAEGERLERERALAHDYAARTTQAALYQPVLDAWRGYAGSDVAGLVRASTLEEAEDRMRARVADAFVRFGGEWIGAERLPLRVDGGLETMRIEARGALPSAALTGFLEALELETPYLFVEALDARRETAAINAEDDASVAQASAQRASNAVSQTVSTIELRVRLSAYRLSEERP